MNQHISQKSALLTRQKSQEKNNRRARTRTLIQAGSLLNLVGLFELCDLKEGDDLQLNDTAKDKAAILLGILCETLNALPASLTDTQRSGFKKIGIQKLKQITYEKMKNEG
jgi:hypothetical protein